MEEPKFISDVCTSILDKPAFLIAVDKTIDQVEQFYTDEDQRSVEIVSELVILCCKQGELIVSSAEEDLPPEDKLYKCLCVADERWDLARRYILDTRHFEVHPMAIITLFYSTMKKEGEHAAYEVALKNVLDRYASSMEDEIRAIMGWSKEDPKQEQSTPKIPSIKDDPELLLEFFQTFKKLGTVHRSRDLYHTEEEKLEYDKLMSIFAALTEETGGSKT